MPYVRDDTLADTGRRHAGYVFYGGNRLPLVASTRHYRHVVIVSRDGGIMVNVTLVQVTTLLHTSLVLRHRHTGDGVCHTYYTVING